jgi:hypothetical protein
VNPNKPTGVDTCAFLPCDQADVCAFIWSHTGGCIKKPGYTGAPLETRSVVQYNPMTGTRLDLVVTDGETEATRLIWRAKRIVYLEALVADEATSTPAREMYRCELRELLAEDLKP